MGRRILKPEISFARTSFKKYEGGYFQTYKLCMIPGDSVSPIYKLSVPFFTFRTPEEWICFRKNVSSLFLGQDVITGPTLYDISIILLQGDKLTVFEAAVTANGAQTTANFKLCMDDVTKHVFPVKACQTQKCYMHR